MLQFNPGWLASGSFLQWKRTPRAGSNLIGQGLQIDTEPA